MEKSMVRRTSCLQSNADFLQKLISKNASDSQQKLDAASRAIDDLKSAVAIFQKRVSQLQAAVPTGNPKWLTSPRESGSIRRDCLDHVAIFGEQHLRHLLSAYQQYYNESRTHLSLKKDAPIPRDAQKVGRVLALPILGGLHHRYVRV